MMQCHFTDEERCNDGAEGCSSNAAEICSSNELATLAEFQAVIADNEPAVLPSHLEEEKSNTKSRTEVQQVTVLSSITASDFCNTSLECSADGVFRFENFQNESVHAMAENELDRTSLDNLNPIVVNTASPGLSGINIDDSLQQNADCSHFKMQGLISRDLITNDSNSFDNAAQLQPSIMRINSESENQILKQSTELQNQLHGFEQADGKGSEFCVEQPLQSLSEQSLSTGSNGEQDGANSVQQVTECSDSEQYTSSCSTSDSKTEIDYDCLFNSDGVLLSAADLSHDELASTFDSLVNKCFLLQKKIEKQIAVQQKIEEDASDLNAQLDSVTVERDEYLTKLNKFEELSLGDSEEVKQLELAVEQQKQQILLLKDKLSSQEASYMQTMASLQSDLKSQIEQLRKKYEECDRDKQSMVMKYAQAEQKNIELQEKMNKMDGWLKDWGRQRDNIMGRLNATAAEKQKLSQLLENRSSEVVSLKREVERQKELVSSHELKAKWHQNKLKVELESHKETKSKIEEMQQKLKESKEECEKVRLESQTVLKTYQMTQVMDSITKELQLKETEEQLQNHRMEQTEQMEVLQNMKQELESLKLKEKELVEELNTYKDKVKCLEAERVLQEETLAKFKETLQNQKTQNRDLMEQLAELESIKPEMTELRLQLTETQKEVEELKQSNEDLMGDVDGYINQESEHLKFSQRLSDETVRLQSENLALGDEIALVSNERDSLKSSISCLTIKCDELEANLKSTLESKQLVVETLERKLNEATYCVQQQTKQLEERDDELKTLKRRHISSSKDLRRQLSQFQRRLEQYENKCTTGTSSTMSRSSSSGSLDSNTTTTTTKETHHGTRENSCNISSISDIDKEVLIDKIIKLQKSNARKTEKIEFMQDHIDQLLEEVRKKSRIIQNYIMREESYSLGPAEAVKLSKTVAAKRSGIVTSMFVSSETGRDVYEDLAEHNSRLQTVLEDKVIHNLTLKHTVETLGQEISHLSNENRILQLEVQDLRNKITHSSG